MLELAQSFHATTSSSFESSRGVGSAARVAAFTIACALLVLWSMSITP
jgi:hypothetical protein